MNATAKSHVIDLSTASAEVLEWAESVKLTSNVVAPAISAREAFVLAKAGVREIDKEEDLREAFDTKRNVHYLRSEQTPTPGSRYLSEQEENARNAVEGITGDTNDDVLDIGVLNGCDAFCLAAIRASGTSEFSMSGSALKLAAPMMASKRIPMTANDQHVDYAKLIDATITAGLNGDFCPGKKGVSEKLLSTYWVIRRLVICTMKEFASIIRDPKERLMKDATGLFLDLDTGELRDDIRIDADLTVSIAEVEGSAMEFYTAATTGRAAQLLTNARKFAPIDTVQVGRIKKSCPRDLNFPVGVQQSQTDGKWDPELLLSWSQLVCNVAIEVTKEGKWVEKDSNLLDF